MSTIYLSLVFVLKFLMTIVFKHLFYKILLSHYEHVCSQSEVSKTAHFNPKILVCCCELRVAASNVLLGSDETFAVTEISALTRYPFC